MKSHLILIGPPGSGKGTQAKKLAKEYGYKHLSTGDLLRQEVARGTDLGREVKAVLDAGQLVNDDLMIKLILANCDPKKNFYVFDGYPRNKEQAVTLAQNVLSGSPVKAIFFCMLADDLVQRLSQRRICDSCGAIYNLKTKAPLKDGVCDSCGGRLSQRKDDQEQVIRDRLQLFDSKSQSMLDLYEKDGILHRINGNDEVDSIFRKLGDIVQ